MQSAVLTNARVGDMVQDKEQQQNEPASGANPDSVEQIVQGITGQLKSMRFKKRTFGGVDEADVWKKLLKLNDMYSQALHAERARYNALLASKQINNGGEQE